MIDPSIISESYISMGYVDKPVHLKLVGDEESSQINSEIEESELAASDELQNEARRIYARVYLREGYVEEDDIDALGYIKDDPYLDRSKWFHVDTEGSVCVARQISPEKKRRYGFTIESPLQSLPTIENFSCSAEVIKNVAGVNNVTDIRSDQVVEISALACEKNESYTAEGFGPAIQTYITMIKSSLESGHKLWVMATDHRLTKKLERLLGKELVHRLGDSKHYMGSETDPICLNPMTVVSELLKKQDSSFQKRAIIDGLQDIDTAKISRLLRSQLIENGVKIKERNPIIDAVKRKKAELTAGAVLLAYTTVKALPLGGIEEFKGDPRVFAALDIGTVPPYVIGLSMLLKGGSVKNRTIGAGLAAGSFAAPYAYLWAEGESYPAWVNGAIISIAGLSAASQIKRIYSERKASNFIQEK